MIATLTSPLAWPFVVLALSVLFIIIAISKLKLHPFLAMMMAGLFAGLLSAIVPDSTLLPDGTLAVNSVMDVTKLLMTGFGTTAGNVAMSIGLASIIACCLMLSGAADRVVTRFLQAFGDERAGLALLVSTYILSIPIFFDTMFMLMVPLAIALHKRTGKDFLLYILCICSGGVIPHCLTVPHPGPIAMVDTLKIDAGFSILVSMLVGIIPSGAGYFVAKWMNARVTIPLRVSLENSSDTQKGNAPSFFASLLPILIPIGLIGISSMWKIFGGMPAVGETSVLRNLIDFIGDKNIALLIGAIMSMWLLKQSKGMRLAELGETLAKPLETAGLVILITSAGGAFGSMIKNAGVGSAVKHVSEGAGISMILLAYVISLVMRVAQGSSTVAMITASAIMYPLLGSDLPYHPIYIYLSIGFASFALGWMNDSGFWVVSRLSGMTEKETLKYFSMMLSMLSLLGLAVTWLGSVVLPMVSK